MRRNTSVDEIGDKPSINNRGSDLRTGRSGPGVGGGTFPCQAGPLVCVHVSSLS